MRTIFTLAILLLFFTAHTQSLCATANEGGTVSLTAPPGTVFISVTFASYGTPNGSCGGFTIGGCHASNSKAIVESYVLGNNSANIPANNAVFGDPCGGTVKRLYVEAIYSSLAPLRLLSFSGMTSGNKNILQWETTSEINTHSFVIEYSTDGTRFNQAGVVNAFNRSGNNIYNYSENSTGGTCFYRLKMMDVDGKFTYSAIIKLSPQPVKQLTLFPNPATHQIAISGLEGNGIIELFAAQGKLLQRVNVNAQAQTLDLEQYARGVYIIKYNSGKGTQSRMILKR